MRCIYAMLKYGERYRGYTVSWDGGDVVYIPNSR